ncbi:MAG TPA: 3-dehydroquinate synthase [Candidatus Mediterraneibacter merdipullorum]|nr:3-dehydroquinate synthase [Candidatus Mediterraneibacter merdipullorum]
MKLTVNLGKDSYPIYIENGILQNAGAYIPDIFPGNKIMILSDDRVYPLYGQKLMDSLTSLPGQAYECRSLVLPHGEPTKSFQSLPEIYRALLDAKLTRSDLVIALGGGVIGDLAGFAAASYLRGIRFVQIPTSLLAQVDSSVGGKVAVDLPQGKNLVGAFFQPKLVLIDPEVLDTLPEHFIRDGMGEVIKYGCIKDPDLFHRLCSCSSFAELRPVLPEIIARCVDIKRIVVEADQFDTGERMLLNFGHTLAHTIEQYFHYERESHGEAVGIGMYQLTKMAEEKGLTAPGCAEQIRKALEIYGLPTSCGLPLSRLTAAISLDKKNLNGRLNLVLLHRIGDSYVHPSDLSFFTDSAPDRTV